MFKILKKEEIAPSTFFFEVEAPFVARRIKAGQFIVLRIDEKGERIPLSYCGADPERGVINLIVQSVGKTSQKLNDMKEGDAILDLVGPLGKETEIEKYGTCVLLGGGFGAGAIIPIAKALRAAGNHVVSIVGAREKSLLVMEKDVEAASDEIKVTTNDGSYGMKGMVTDALSQILADRKVDFILGIGPVPMMKAISDMTKPYGIKTMVSLNSVMVDGTGMCGSCRVTVGGETKFACVDGPDFDGHQVDYDELSKRLKMFEAYEKLAYEAYLEHRGRCASEKRSDR
ncbi:MAG: sulfide/dihydroorotate dehydrogenase-like FAD/NAD-binding protein [Acidobacteriota bacterium]